MRSRLYIINDRQADDRDDFDLNLFPTAPAPGAASASGDASGGPAPPPGDGSPTTIGISPSTTSSSLSLHKTPTKSKIVDSLFTRKHSAAVTDHSHHHHHPHLPHLHHAATFPLVASPIGEAAPGADGRTWPPLASQGIRLTPRSVQPCSRTADVAVDDGAAQRAAPGRAAAVEQRAKRI